MPKVEFHFDFGSPNAYLAHLVIPEIEQRTGAKFEYMPVLLGGPDRPQTKNRHRSAS
jgi:2-hydroxychromene-2-carboxylate isomerase